MKKIPTMFERDWKGDRSRVLDRPHQDCAWVFRGEGKATIKLDGMCAMIRDGKLYKRREIKPGQTPPPDFQSLGEDAETGKTVGWVPVGDGPEDAYFREARGGSSDGTYELVGPKVQGGAEARLFSRHELVPHGMLTPVSVPPRDFAGLREWLQHQDIEGIVFHHPDGRMAKIKQRDFGLDRAGLFGEGGG